MFSISERSRLNSHFDHFIFYNDRLLILLVELSLRDFVLLVGGLALLGGALLADALLAHALRLLHSSRRRLLMYHALEGVLSIT